MLGKPEAGWTDITIGSQYIGTASYLDDVPVETMDAFLKYYQGAPFQVTYDAEGYHFGLFTFDGLVYIVDNKSDNEEINTKVIESEKEYFGGYISEEYIIHTLAKECVNDVREHIDGWVDWFTYDDPTPEEVETRKKLLLDKADVLEAYIKTDSTIRYAMLEKVIQDCLRHIQNGETEFQVDADDLSDAENQYVMQEVEKRMNFK